MAENMILLYLSRSALSILAFGRDHLAVVIAMLAIGVNLLCIAVIIKRSVQMRKNPYSNEVFQGTKDYEEAMARADV